MQLKMNTKLIAVAFWSKCRLVIGSAILLKNWKDLVSGTLRERRGEQIKETPVLRFRSGLELAIARGGYGGWRILFREIFLNRVYEPNSHFAIKDGWTVVDIGANMGLFTCKAAKAGKNVHVVAVEPVSHYVDTLRENARKNGLHNVILLHGAASGKAGDKVTISLWHSKSGEVKAGYEIPPESSRQPRIESETVAGITLSEIFERGQVKRCDFLKVDIEGAEYEFFGGIPAELWRRIDRVSMETHKTEHRDPSQISELLEKHGFAVIRKGEMLWASKA
ncbi:MAG: FkbM family methyltransferase [Verrucomicrobia bacterium]|nr:FkbM family methyltransferase [Verrucomicrobiota bacterium]